jgi:chemotaxis protein MotA
MFPIIGIVVVFGCIAGGYLMEKGNMLVLMQPAELLIIGGAAIGTVLIGNPPHVLKAIIGGLLGVFKGSRYTSGIYPAFLERLLSDRPQEQPIVTRRRSGRPRQERSVQKAS